MFLFLKSLTWRHGAVIAAVFLFFSCSFEDNNHLDTGFIPAGVWASLFDSYTIDKDSVNYFMAGSEWEGTVYPDTVLKGNIEKAVDFSHNAGVLIIKITEASYNTVGKYTGIYYSEYTSSSIKISTAYADGSVEADTLTAALALFTVDTAGDHVAVWGSYTQ